MADIDLLEGSGGSLYEVKQKFEPGMRYSGEAFRERDIEVLYVEQNARGKGVSAALLGACLDWAEKRGAKRVRAGVYAQNKASLGLFERFGLHPHHVTVLKALE